MMDNTVVLPIYGHSVHFLNNNSVYLCIVLILVSTEEKEKLSPDKMCQLKVAEHSCLSALVLMRGSARTKIAKSDNLFVLHLFHLRVFPSYNNTRCCRF